MLHACLEDRTTLCYLVGTQATTHSICTQHCFTGWFVAGFLEASVILFSALLVVAVQR